MDNKFLEFCEDVKNALIEQDKLMYQKMTNENVSDFYENDWRGLGFFSTTEPILKNIIMGYIKAPCKTGVLKLSTKTNG